MRIFLVLVNLVFGALAAPNGWIIGGDDATPGEFPHMLSLQWHFIEIRRHNCGASIINELWALTAAHCITETVIEHGGSLSVIAGAWDFRSPSTYQQEVAVERFVNHPLYPGGGVVAPHDIGVMRLAEALVFNDWVKPVVFPQPNTLATGMGVFSGWGNTSPNPPSVFPYVLQRADMPILTLSECFDTLVQFNAAHLLNIDGDICTGPLTGGLSACSADSGSPMGQWDGDDFIQMGVAAWTIFPCGRVGAPTVHARVSAYIDWIHENIAE
ncbi:hypothetical protein DMENIID0001_007340 [Sergentomyia squamirostris]